MEHGNEVAEGALRTGGRHSAGPAVRTSGRLRALPASPM